ncbi:hypothetical protein VUJ46_01970 [Chryseobacterium sp. MYb264]|uniref:hypothetical protein n=1 Tax=Chryseobacterium sp. MYb264 TaxID=2745153 RepID=UPI002E13A5DF|nr:hypothetical protein VUJ46_01970 [Chryseobacterium sp. MYb264]
MKFRKQDQKEKCCTAYDKVVIWTSFLTGMMATQYQSLLYFFNGLINDESTVNVIKKGA